MIRRTPTRLAAAALAFTCLPHAADAAPFTATATLFDVGYDAAGTVGTGPLSITATGDNASFGVFETLFGFFPGVALDSLTVEVAGAVSAPIAFAPGEAYALLDMGAIGLFVDIPGDGSALTDLIGNTLALTPPGFMFDADIGPVATPMQLSSAFIGVTFPVSFPTLGGAGLTITGFGAPITPTILEGAGEFALSVVPLPAAAPLALAALGALAMVGRRRGAPVG